MAEEYHACIRLNWCMILHVHKDDTDMLDLQAVANDFVCHNSSRHTSCIRNIYRLMHTVHLSVILIYASFYKDDNVN